MLREVLERLGSGANPVKTAITCLGEKASRVKLGGGPGTYSDLNRLEELELLLLGVRGKLALWQALEAVADERLSGVDFAALSARAEGQLEHIEQHRLRAARATFAAAPPGR